MSDLDLVGLREIAEAADEVYEVYDDHSAVWEYDSVMHPGTVLALLDRIEELEAELVEYRKREAETTVERSVRVLEDMSRQAIQRTVGPWMEVDDD